MVSRREALAEAQHAWRVAERSLASSGGGRRAELVIETNRLREAYHQLATHSMADQIAELHQADHSRRAATPSTPEFHAAVRRSEAISAEIWEQAGRSDREASRPRGHLD